MMYGKDVRIVLMDQQRFYHEWCLSKETVRYRYRVLKTHLRSHSAKERTGLAHYILDRALKTYFHPCSGAKNRVIHNIYHTLRCLLSGITDRKDLFIPMLMFALNIQHCYLHERFFSLLLRDIDPETALTALEWLYLSSHHQQRPDYVRVLLPRITIPSLTVLKECVIGIVNSWGDRTMHEEILFHARVGSDQYRDLLTDYIRDLGMSIEEFSHQKRLRLLIEIVDRILVHCVYDGSAFSPEISQRFVLASRYREQRSEVIRQIREDVAYRPGNHGMDGAMEDFLLHARLRR